MLRSHLPSLAGCSVSVARHEREPCDGVYESNIYEVSGVCLMGGVSDVCLMGGVSDVCLMGGCVPDGRG